MLTGKKLLSGLTSLSLLSGIAVSPVSLLAESSLPFNDVKSSDYFVDGVKYCYEHGILTGKNETTFAPAENMTRAQLVTALYRHDGEKPSLFTSSFKDVIPGSWSADAIHWASENGIVNGYDADRFGPDDALKREDLAKILKAYNDYKGYRSSKNGDLGVYPDGENVSDYAKEALTWALGQSIIVGMQKDQTAILNAKGTASRGQCAIMLQRFLSDKTSDQNDSDSIDSAPLPNSISLEGLEAAGYLTDMNKAAFYSSSDDVDLHTASGENCNPCIGLTGHDSSFVLKNTNKMFKTLHFSLGYLSNGFHLWNDIRVIGVNGRFEDTLCNDARHYAELKSYDFYIGDYDEIRFYHFDYCPFNNTEAVMVLYDFNVTS